MFLIYFYFIIKVQQGDAISIIIRNGLAFSFYLYNDIVQNKAFNIIVDKELSLYKTFCELTENYYYLYLGSYEFQDPMLR